MTRLSRVFLAFCLLAASVCSSQLQAQEESPSVTVMQAGGNRLLEDLKYIVELDPVNGKAQWENIEGIILVFAGGVNMNKPIRFDILLDGEKARYRPSFPIDNFANFQANLEAFGIGSKKLSKDFYQLDGQVFNGFLRMVDGYAVIGETKADVPDTFGNPAAAIQPLVDKKFDVAAHVRNTAAGQAKRRESFGNVRKELLAAVNKKKDESETDFSLRKLAIEHQLAEAERFFVESSEITLGWTTDIDAKEGRLDINLSALEGTALAKTIQQLAIEPSLFANVQLSGNSILSMRVNHAIDAMRTDHLNESLDLLQPAAQEHLEKSENLSDDEKTNLKEASEIFFAMVRDGVKQGVVDGFTDISQDEKGVRSMVGGIRVTDAGRVVDIIKLVPQKSGSHTTEMNADKAGDVDIHRVAPPSYVQEKLKGLFADDAPLYVAASENAVWYAVGEQGLAAMKEAIGKAAAPKQTVENSAPAKADDTEKASEEAAGEAEAEKEADTKESKGDEKADDAPAAQAVNPVFFELKLKAGPWAEFRNQQRGDEGNAEFRKLMLKAFESGDDNISFKLERIDDHVEGRLRIGQAIFRLVGSLIAKFAKENL